MERAGVAADHELSVTQELRQLTQVRARGHARGGRPGQLFFARTPDDERALTQPTGQFAEVQPFFFPSSRSRHEDDVVGRWLSAVGGELLEVDFGCLFDAGELQVPLDDVPGGIDVPTVIHQPYSRLLTDELSGETDAVLRARRARKQRGFHQALKVDRHVESGYGAARLANVPQRPSLERDRDGAHAGDDLHQLAVRRLHHPRHVESLAQRNHGGNGMDHIPQG